MVGKDKAGMGRAWMGWASGRERQGCLEQAFGSLSGITKGQFGDLVTHIDDGLRSSKARSVRTVLGIFLLKLRTALGNSIIGTLFQMTKFQVCTFMFLLEHVLLKTREK